MTRANRAESDGLDDYTPESYGTAWAAYYDDIFAESADAVDLLEELAGQPPRALELAIGTGRVGLPLAGRGVRVHGIEISEAMVEKLKAKRGAESIDVTVGDFADVGVNGSFPLIYLPFNTLFALLDQERQVECFQNVAQHLETEGRFVLDCFVPDIRRYDEHNTRMAVSSINSTREHAYELSIHHPLTQRVTSHQVRRQADGHTLVLPVKVRYAWPSELDLMGRLAGLELEHRWGWYDRRPFTEASGQHVSVYRKP